MSSLLHNSGVVVLLPFATPHKSFKQGGAFHPAALLFPQNRRANEYDEMKDYSGFASVAFATKVSHTVVATIPPKTTVAGMMLDQLISSYTDVNNILAEVERVEVEETSIASQIKVVFDMFPSAKSVLVVWPYQIFNLEKPLMADEKASFTFSHPMLNVRRDMIPEAIGVSTDDESKENEIDCKDVADLSTLDGMLKGSYTRVISSVEIAKDDFYAFVTEPEYPNLVPLLKRTLAGKRGILTTPEGHNFI